MSQERDDEGRKIVWMRDVRPKQGRRYQKTPGMGRAARVLVGLRRSCDVASKVDAVALRQVAGLR